MISSMALVEEAGWGVGAEGGAAVVTLLLPVAQEVGGEGLDVVVEAELVHGPQQVLGGDGLALLPLAAIIGLAGDEADELRDALLDRLLGVVRYLGMGRQHLPHYTYHVGYRHVPVLLPHRRRAALHVVGSGGDGDRRLLDVRQLRQSVHCCVGVDFASGQRLHAKR